MPARVTVILPVYNAAPFLAHAVRSILSQTHSNLQLLALNDGSTDNSPAILQSLAARDPRLQIFQQPNAGAVASLNRLLDLALAQPADFIALMHADDLALPARLHKQLAYFSTHPEISILGTWIQSFLTPNSPPPIENQNWGEAKIENPPPSLTPRPWHYPSDPRFTKPSLLFWCCFAHPTIMFRRHVLAGTPQIPPLRYDPDFPMPCEDYALWARASRHHLLSNVPEILLHYRLHPAQGGLRHQQRTASLTAEIRRRQLLLLGITPSPDQLTLHQRLAEDDHLPTPTYLRHARTWLERLHSANTLTPTYDPDAFLKILAARWAAACLHAAHHHLPDVWPQFHASPLAPHVNLALEKNRQIPPPSPLS